MRFPFFKNEKVETKPTVRAPIPVRRSSLADTQPLQRLPGNLASDTQRITPLSSGKVTVKLEDIVTLLPAHVLRSPLPPVSDQQSVVLPLHEVIAAIPPDLLHIEHESEISADDPELDKLP